MKVSVHASSSQICVLQQNAACVISMQKIKKMQILSKIALLMIFCNFSGAGCWKKIFTILIEGKSAKVNTLPRSNQHIISVTPVLGTRKGSISLLKSTNARMNARHMDSQKLPSFQIAFCWNGTASFADSKMQISPTAIIEEL